MSGERITRRDLVLTVATPVAGAAVSGIIGWYTGSFEVVLSFVGGHPLESLLWSLLLLSLGALVGLLVRGHSAKKALAAKDAEIAAVRAEYEDPARRMREVRETVSRLPDGQKAALGVALGSAEPVPSQGRADCLRALAGLGLVEDVGGVSRERWSATDLARRAVTGDLSAELAEAAERMREGERAEEVAGAVRRLLHAEYRGKALLARVMAVGDDGLAIPVQGWPDRYGRTDRTNDVLEALSREGWCDFEVTGDDERTWRATDLLREACAAHPGLLPEVES